MKKDFMRKGGNKMREIKFRAWDKKNNHMIYDVQTEIKIGEVGFTSGKLGKMNMYTHFDEYFNDDNFEMMQYTGLKDKNDKEIYEGHIVKLFYPDMGHKIIFDKDTAMFGYYYKSIYGKFFCGLYRHLKDIEIIGNIYENPELREEVNE